MLSSWSKVVTAIIAVIAIIAVAVVLLLQAAGPSVDVPLELSKAALNLMSALIIAGILSAVLAKVAADRAERDERYRSLVASLQELKAAHERMQVARFYLQAQRTALTLVENLSMFVESRAMLQLVQRDRFVSGTQIEENIEKMLDYILQLGKEYRSKAEEVAQAALQEEGLRQAIRDGKSGSVSNAVTLNSSSYPAIAALVMEDEAEDSGVSGLYGGRPWDAQPFRENYRSARDALQALIEASAPGAWSRSGRR